MHAAYIVWITLSISILSQVLHNLFYFLGLLQSNNLRIQFELM